LGFGFSAGLFDYVLNFNKATRPWLLLPVGAAYFALYYGVFRWVIARFDLKTPGREDEAPAAAPASAAVAGGRAGGFIGALGGAGNLVAVEACTTRLRLVVADQAAVDEAALKALGARGFVRPSKQDLQVVLGPQADDVAREIRAELGVQAALPEGAPTPAARAPEPAQPDRSAIVAAVGGPANLVSLESVAGRLLLRLTDPAQVDEAALRRLGVRALARTASGSVHLVLGPA
jgi:PTS system N-acetylglucosamine-specific IIC component